MNGKISFKTDVDAGTEFIIKIPFLYSGEKIIQKDIFNIDYKKILDDYFSNAKVLLVEDNIMNQKAFGLIMKKIQPKYDIANDGLEAVELCKNTKYDLIFMDIRMPNMDGLEATTVIREKGSNKESIIIGLSANAYAEDKTMALEAGMNLFISKPVSVNKITTELAQYLRKLI